MTITLTREEAQQVLDALMHAHAREPMWKSPIRTATETLRARLAQPEPEPVAWYLPSDEGFDSLFRDHRTVVACTGNKWEGWQPLYTAPPQREWRGLTDEEAAELCHAPIAVIEAKLKEKNASHL